MRWEISIIFRVKRWSWCGEKDGMGHGEEDGMDGEMALHAIPTIGDNHDQHGH